MSAVLNRQADAANALLRSFANLDRTTDSYDPSGQFISANSAILEMNANLGVQTTLLQQQNSLLANLAEQSAAATREANRSKDAWGGVGSAIKAAMSFLSVKAVKGFVDNVFELSNTQLKAEVQLATVMNNQGSGIEDFDAIKERASAIQGKTMFGDEAMISGAAELSTYISDTEAISHMMGTLANYAAGMSGCAEVGVAAMTEYATQLGKALDGTYDGLKEKGFELSEEQQNIIENGTDMQKALVLDEVISQSWAGLAENMRNTPTGAITSLNNTIGDIGEVIGARITPAFMTLADKVEQFVNSSGFETLVDSLVISLTTLFDVLTWGAGVIQWTADNWGWLAPAALTAAGAIGAYKLAVGLANLVQLAFNGALLSCPIFWIIAGVAAFVGILALVINAINSCTGSTLTLGGVIGGTLMVVLGALGNVFLWIANVGAGVWSWLRAGFDNLVIAFQNGIADIQIFWYSLLSTVLKVVEGICAALNWLPFISFDYSGVTNLADEYAQKSAEIAASKQEYKDVGKAWNDGYSTFDYIDLGEAWNAGNYLGDSLFGGGNDASLAGYAPADYIFDSGAPTGTADDPIHTNVDNDVNIAEEDLKLMRDVAEARYVQNFVTLTPTVQVSGNTINERVDVKHVVDEIEERLTVEIAASAEGIYG